MSIALASAASATPVQVDWSVEISGMTNGVPNTVYASGSLGVFDVTSPNQTVEVNNLGLTAIVDGNVLYQIGPYARHAVVFRFDSLTSGGLEALPTCVAPLPPIVNTCGLEFTLPGAGRFEISISALLADGTAIATDSNLTGLLDGTVSYTGSVVYAYTVVPEPGTAALFAIGLLGIATRARRFESVAASA